MKQGGELDLESVIDSSRVGRFQIVIIVLCAMVAMMDGFDTQSIAFVAPEIINAWGASPSAFGPVFGAGLLGGLFGALLFGAASDRFGRKPTLLFAILVFAAGSLVTPLAASIPHLIAIRFATGIGLGGALPSFISLTSEYAPKRLRATLVALMFCGFPLGAVVGGIASAMLIPAFGWPSVFIVGGVLPILLLPLFVRFMPESVRFLALRQQRDGIERILKRLKSEAVWNGALAAAPPQAHSPVSSLFKQGRASGTLLLWAAFFLSMLLTYFLVNWIPVIARRSGFGIQSAVLAVSMLNLGAVLGCIVIGRLADRFRPAVTIGCSYVIGAIAIASIGHAGQSSALLYLAAFLAGAFSIGAQMCTVALCANFYETFLRSTGVGASMGIGRIGAIVGPLLGGLLLGAGVDAQTLFVVAGLTSFGAALAVYAMGWCTSLRRASADDPPEQTGARVTAP